MKSMFEKQRKRLRVAWRTDAMLRIVTDGRVVKAVTRNISARGLLVFCDETLEVGTALQIRVDLSAHGVELAQLEWPMELRATVSHCDLKSENLFSVVFDDMLPEQERAMRSAVYLQAMRLMDRIAEFPAFWDLTELEQITLTTVCHEVSLREGEALVRLGDEATSLFLVKSGKVRLSSPNAGPGSDGEVEVAQAGQVFGEMSALLGLPHNLDIVALAPTELLAFPRDSLNFLRELNPSLALSLYEIFTAFMGRRLRKLTNRLFTPINF